MPDKTVTVTLSVKDGFSAQARAFVNAMDQAEKSVSKSSQAMQQLGNITKTAAIAGFGALTAAFAASIQKSMELESTFGKIAGLTGTAKGSIDGLRESVIRMSTDIPVSANELAQGLYFVSSSGYQGADAMKILEASGKAAAAGLGETKTIADAVTSALNAYGLGAGEATRITDILVQTVKEGKGEPAELAGSLGKILPIAAQAGVSMEQVAASMATMTRTGMNADEAATSLRGTIAALMAPGKQAVDALAQIGLTTEDVAAKMRSPEGLIGVLQLLMERTGGNVAELDAIIPNIRALTGVLSTAGSQGAEYARILESMQGAAGATDNAFASMSDTMEFKLKKAQNSLEALGTTITNKLLPGLGQAADAASTLINWQDKMSEAFTATEAKIRTGSQSYEEYKSSTEAVGRAAGLVTDVFIMGQGEVTKYADSFKMLTEEQWNNERAQAAVAKGAENLSKTQDVIQTAMMGSTQATKDATGADYDKIASGKELEKQNKLTADYYGGLTQKAIDYTETEEKEAELRKKLADLDKEIAAAGQAHIGTVQKKTMTENEYAAAVAKSAKIQEDLTSGARKKNESDAEYESRMANLRVQLDKVNASLGAQSGIIGGATKAQLENRDAILEQIKALQLQDNQARAMEGFAALKEALKSGAIDVETYTSRTTALNNVTHAFTPEALAAAQAQEAYLRVLSDPNATLDQINRATYDYRKNLSDMPAVIESAQAAEDKAQQARSEAAQKIKDDAQAKKDDLYGARGVEKEDVTLKVGADTKSAETSMSALKDKKIETTAHVNASVDKADASIQAFKRDTESKPIVIKVSTVTTDQGVAERDKQQTAREANAKIADSTTSVTTSIRKANDDVTSFASKSKDQLKGVGDTTQTTFAKMAETVAAKFGLTSKSVTDAFALMQQSAVTQIGTINSAIETYLPTYRELIYKITVRGEVPEGEREPRIPGTGAQHGANFIVPDNRRGGMQDYYPIIAAPGERVIVQTVAQQQQTRTTPQRGGDVYNETTNIYNPLAAAMWLDKQRRERIARSEARMGV